MLSNREKKILITWSIVGLLWMILPLTTKATGFAGFIETGQGYVPVANFFNHHAPPVIGGRTFEHIVWKHPRYSFLWLGIGGSTAGEYGLYKPPRSRRRSRGRVGYFLPLTVSDARHYAAKINVKLPDKWPVSYWSLWFGWIVIFAAAGLYFIDEEAFEGVKL